MNKNLTALFSTIAISSLCTAALAAPPKAAAPPLPSVTKALPQFKAEDAFDLAKVKEAIALVPPESIVHTVPFVPGNGADYEYRPSPRSAESAAVKGHGDSCVTKKGIAKFGLLSFKESNPGRLGLVVCDTVPGLLAENTPGIVWSIQGRKATFVTLDGGVYEARTEKLVPGVPTTDAWGKPLQHAYLMVRDVDALTKSGHIAAEAAGVFEKARDTWAACNDKVWEKAEPELKKNAAAAIDYNTKEARRAQIVAKYDKVVDAQCGQHQKSYEAAIEKILEPRTKQRLDIYEDAKKRLAK